MKSKKKKSWWNRKKKQKWEKKKEKKSGRNKSRYKCENKNASVKLRTKGCGAVGNVYGRKEFLIYHI